MHLSLGLSLTGRNGLSNRVRIVVADDGVSPAMADVESGDTIADAFPATSLDTANYEVVGDETDSIAAIFREWSLNGEDWVSESVDYYIDPDAGDDGNDGNLPNAAFASLAPLLALANNTLDGLTVAVKKGTTLAPMDLDDIVADNFTLTTYGSGARPYIDCTDAIPASWTLHAAGVYKVTLTHDGDSKTFPNVFRDGAPMRKVESIAALSGKGNYVCHIDDHTADSMTLYMNAPGDPGADGAAYTFSKYGSAITITGEGNTLKGIEAFGSAHQDGALRLPNAAGENTGGHTLEDCKVSWGTRHSALVGSGASPSYVKDCEFLGAANDIETGGSLSNGFSNAVVFNTTDHSAATCYSQNNTYDNNDGTNWITGGPSMTGPYGHDGTSGQKMTAFVSSGDTFTDLPQVSLFCATTGTMSGATFENVETIFGDPSGTGHSYTMSSCTGEADVLLKNTGTASVTLTTRNNTIDIVDCGAGSAGFLRAGEGSNAVTNFDSEGDTFDVQGIRVANTNRFLFRIREGSVRIKDTTVLPAIAVPLNHVLDIGIGGASVTVDAETDGNTWPIGAVFQRAGTSYSLESFISAGYEGAASTSASVPAVTFSDTFNRSDETDLSDGGYARVSGTSGTMAVKSNALASLLTGTAVYTRGDLGTAGVIAKKVIKGIASGGGPGIALKLTDATNFIILRETSSAYQIQVCDSGSFSQPLNISGTPAVDDEVYAVLKPYTDPNTSTESWRAWIIVNNRAIASLQSVTVPSGLQSERTVGFVSRNSAVNPLLDNVEWSGI